MRRRPSGGPETPVGPILGPLRDFGATDTAAAGGKGANLGELARAGFPVPAGFIITTAAYHAMLQDTGLDTTLARLLAAGAPGATIRAAIAAVRMPDPLRGAVREAYRSHCEGAVAVRSSATAEDLPGATFAGQQDTFLNIVGDAALFHAVSGCWASLWTDRAIAYRHQRGIGPEGVAMAVVVQRMVDADVSGVMFSADPVSGRRDAVIVDASPGLGEAVVAGRVTPEHYLLTRRGHLRQWTPGGHETLVRPVPGGGTVEVPGTPANRPSLTRRQRAALAGLSRRVAAHFGTPQDMEWAVAGGHVFLLQARPMTALPPEPLRLNAFQRKLGPFFAEMFNDRPYPLDVSGWLEKALLVMLRGMTGSVGVAFPARERIFVEEDGVVLTVIPPVPRPSVRMLAAPASVVARARRFPLPRWKDDKRLAAFLTEVRRLNDVDVRQLSWRDLVLHVQRVFDALGPITALRVSYLPGLLLAQLKLWPLLALLGRLRLGSALIAGARTRTTDANEQLERLAARVRSSEGLRQLFADVPAPELLPRLGVPQFAEFNRALDGFLAEYGHRECISVALSSSPTWSERPDVVLGIVKALAAQQGRTADHTGQALRELASHPALRNPWLRRQVFAAVAGSKAGMGFREDTHFYATMLLPPLRRALLELGERLWAVGVLDDAGDIWHLRFEELRAITDPGSLADQERGSLRSTVIARSAKRRALTGQAVVNLDALFANRKAVPGALITGTGASRGTATGTVRLIRGPGEFGALRSGEILVCPYTNPSWTPLFQRAAAVVVDAGGTGSHAAIVAREYGVPAVMGTGHATTVLKNGQRVTVNGSTGAVTAAP
ncbi:PEP/pyruvate-binding domain-containing protein [Arthrobacter sp. B3I4]|uniref:PEP/pyruvate-binding domain-containing protein n=1 Tax=Arthrobacter sp. B3I4 TaxID=3042267 RepID=UPI00278A3E69|nr:PEP/pyruvate-binding domain-containing protein [Arthrobacter sp. B3I4]MDQ0756217.1 phosphohistidine swiveling domain-containing protein [Arthrobacter sp. B3I4]